jgi:hypothetical protein
MFAPPNVNTWRWPLAWLIAVLIFAYGKPSHGHPIRHGEEAESCEFPFVASVFFDDHYCSGTLVHPSLILIAAHCGAGPASVKFGDQRAHQGIARSAYCYTNPSYAGPRVPQSDWGYCVLDTEVSSIPTISMLDACSLERLKPGDTVWQVGFGATEGANIRPAGTGIKRYGRTFVADVDPKKGDLATSAEVVSLPPSSAWSPSSGCVGDSGGPAIVQLPDGTWRIVGLLATLLGDECGGDNHYALLEGVAATILQQTGIDLQACAQATDLALSPLACQFHVVSPLGVAPGRGQWRDECSASPRMASVEACQTPWTDPALGLALAQESTPKCQHAATSPIASAFLVVLALRARLRRRPPAAHGAQAT